MDGRDSSHATWRRRDTMKAPAALLLAAVALADGPCTHSRCDIAACPCGCECGNATDRSLLFAGATERRRCSSHPSLVTALQVAQAHYCTSRSRRPSTPSVPRSLRRQGQDEASAAINAASRASTLVMSTIRHAAKGVAWRVGCRVALVPARARHRHSKGDRIQWRAESGDALAPASLKSMGGVNGQGGTMQQHGHNTAKPRPQGALHLFWKLNAEAFIGASSRLMR